MNELLAVLQAANQGIDQGACAAHFHGAVITSKLRRRRDATFRFPSSVAGGNSAGA